LLKLGNFWSIWATLAKIGLLFAQSSGHTEYPFSLRPNLDVHVYLTQPHDLEKHGPASIDGQPRGLGRRRRSRRLQPLPGVCGDVTGVQEEPLEVEGEPGAG